MCATGAAAAEDRRAARLPRSVGGMPVPRRMRPRAYAHRSALSLQHLHCRSRLSRRSRRRDPVATASPRQPCRGRGQRACPSGRHGPHSRPRDAPRARGASSARRRAGLVVDGLFESAAAAEAASSGCGRQTISSLPRCWTGAASSSAQMRASAASRAARSPSAQRTLMSSWALRLESISFSTAGVSAWARARSWRRSEGVGVFMARFYRARGSPGRPAQGDDVMGELSCTSPFDGWTFADCGIKRTLRSTARIEWRPRESSCRSRCGVDATAMRKTRRPRTGRHEMHASRSSSKPPRRIDVVARIAHARRRRRSPAVSGNLLRR